MSLKSLSKEDWEDLEQFISNNYCLNVYFMEVASHINYIGLKTRIYGRAATYGTHTRVYDHLKNIFSIPFNNLPTNCTAPLHLNEKLWLVLYQWRLQSGI